MSHSVGVDEEVPAADRQVGIDITGFWSAGYLFDGDVEADRGAVVICRVRICAREGADVSRTKNGTEHCVSGRGDR